MPLYEYQCDGCHHRFEVIQKFSDPALTTCEQCGGALRKLLSSPAIQFKGSGWYITDYARAGKSGDPKTAAGTDGGGSAEGKTAEAKTEGRTESTKAAGSGDTRESSTQKTKSDAKPSTGTPSTS